MVDANDKAKSEEAFHDRLEVAVQNITNKLDLIMTHHIEGTYQNALTIRP